jgi:TonB-linked SusC/RagA family outer membrane protein
MGRFLAVLCAVLGPPSLALAQQSATITGRVLSDGGLPLASVQVYLEGLNVGGISTADGSYSFTVANASGQAATLTARLIGYHQESASITLTPGAITHDFTLTASPVQLQTMVVTALGQERQKSELGTAQQELNTAELNTTHSPNIVNQLEGKVSGAQIRGSGTQGGSTHIVLRGNNSINGNNEPLFVVDGIAIPNRDRGGDADGGANAGWDFGTVISDLNPSDIASVSILKGPNAAALYGSRAANGVIVITTKGGQNTDGRIRTDLTTTYMWDQVSILPDYQNLYGQGSSGQFKYVDGNGGGIQDYNDQSYGPKLDGRLIDQFTGKQQPWVAHPDNVSSFFNTGRTMNVNLAASGGTDRANARLSVGGENVSGIVPNNFLQKFTSSLHGTLKIGDRLSTNASLQFIRNNGLNRPGVGYNTGILEQFIWFGRQVDMNALRQHYMDYDQFGAHYNWNTLYHSNPFWLQYANPERDTRNNFIGALSADYRLTDWLNADLHFGSNLYSMAIQQDFAPDNVSWAAVGIDDPSYQGGFNLFNNNSNDNNLQFLLNANTQVSPRLQVNGTVGTSQYTANYQSQQQQTAGLLVAGTYNVSNAAIPPTLDQYSEKRQINSVFGSASLTWDGWWTVEGTARNDWSSTLPSANNSYFYPSVNTSLLLTDAIPGLKSNWLSYLKVRGSVAQVGADAQPFQLVTVYSGNSNTFGGSPLYTLGNTVANANLKPEITNSTELGIELGLFNGRANLDASYYDKATKNQIINSTISSATGFDQKAINAGKITNKGFEALLNITPIRTAGGFEWNTTFNFSRNRSNVDALAPGIQTIVLGGSWYETTEARLHQPYGVIYGFSYLRDSATGQLLLHDGKPQEGEQKVLGSIEPDWVGGWNNEFRYKNVALSFLFDIHEGGDIFSVSNMWGEYTGILKSTLRGREADWNDPGILVKGIDDETGKPNTTTVTSEQYFQSLFPIHEAFVYDDSYIKLREVRVGFSVPSRWLNRLHVSSASVAFVGRNLLTHTDVPNIDPEFSYSTGNDQAAEFAALPTPRSFGLNLRIIP